MTLRQNASRRYARQGIAMMMVLSVVAAASILGWAMLSSSTLRSQVDMNAVDAVEANYLAESGVSYAMYYLRYPEKSPVALSTGTYDTHYPGQTRLQLWSDARGTVDIIVANTAKNTFRVRSTATVNGMRRTVAADVKQSVVGIPIQVATGFNDTFDVEPTVRIDGPVSVKGSITGVTANITNSPTITTSTGAVTATPSQVQLLSETGVAASGPGVLATDRTYTVNGKTYVAERAPSTVLVTLLTSRPALNPYNVWYSDSSVTLAGSAITGTLVLRGTASLTASSTNFITQSAGLPALVVGGSLNVRHTSLLPSKLTVTGVTWVGDVIKSSGTGRTDGFTKFDGALLMGGPAPKITGLTSPVNITYKNAAASVTELTPERVITGVTLTGWRQAE